MGLGEAVTVSAIRVGVMLWACVGLTCRVIVATEPAEFWSVVWVGKPELPGRLQEERIITSERNIDRSLNVFNFAFMSSMKIKFGQFD